VATTGLSPKCQSQIKVRDYTPSAAAASERQVLTHFMLLSYGTKAALSDQNFEHLARIIAERWSPNLRFNKALIK